MRWISLLLITILFLSCAKNDEKDLFLKAENLFYAGRIDSAIAMYDSLLRRFPDTKYRTSAERRVDESRQILQIISQARAKLDQGKPDDAFKLFMKARTMNRKAVDSLVVVAMVDSVKRRLAEQERARLRQFRRDITDYYLNVVNEIFYSFNILYQFSAAVSEKKETSDTDYVLLGITLGLVRDRLDSVRSAYQHRYDRFIRRIPPKFSYLKPDIERGWDALNDLYAFVTKLFAGWYSVDLNLAYKSIDDVSSVVPVARLTRKRIINFVIKDRIRKDYYKEFHQAVLD